MVDGDRGQERRFAGAAWDEDDELGAAGSSTGRTTNATGHARSAPRNRLARPLARRRPEPRPPVRPQARRRVVRRRYPRRRAQELLQRPHREERARAPDQWPGRNRVSGHADLLSHGAAANRAEDPRLAVWALRRRPRWTLPRQGGVDFLPKAMHHDAGQQWTVGRSCGTSTCRSSRGRRAQLLWGE